MQANKECIYVERPRPPSSAAALSARLASLEERYRALCEVDSVRGNAAGPGRPSYTAGNVIKPWHLPAPGIRSSSHLSLTPLNCSRSFTPENALNWENMLDFSQLPPPSPIPIQSEFKSDAVADPYLELTLTKTERKLLYVLPVPNSKFCLPLTNVWPDPRAYSTRLDLYWRECYRYTVPIKPTERFWENLEDPDFTRRPHACLINAMYLVALDFATAFPMDPVLDETGARFLDFKIPENLPTDHVLLARAQSHCAQSLADVDRLQDYIQASLLLAYWFFRHGRLMEGQYSMAAVSR